jgi:hypothetical protein
MAANLIHHLPNEVHGHSEANTLPAHHRGIDSDQFPTNVDHGSSRISGIDRGIGLDEVLVRLDTETTHDPRLCSRRSRALKLTFRHNCLRFSSARCIYVTPLSAA